MYAIINTKLILEDSIIYDGAITFEEGVIVQIGKASEVDIPQNAVIIDAQGHYTAPGLVDIHNHGGCDYLFCEDPVHGCKFFLKHGQTTVLPTLYCNLSCQQMLESLEKLKEAMNTPIGSVIAGVYMEGPYMGGFGSNQKHILWGGMIDKQEYMPLIEAMTGIAKVWAIDPARPGIEQFMQDVKALDPNVVFTIPSVFMRKMSTCINLCSRRIGCTSGSSSIPGRKKPLNKRSECLATQRLWASKFTPLITDMTFWSMGMHCFPLLKSWVLWY